LSLEQHLRENLTTQRLPTEINGAQGVIVRADGIISASLTFDFDQAGQVSRIFIMRNPDKLAGLEASLLLQ
jgi:hypothetical protein